MGRPQFTELSKALAAFGFCMLGAYLVPYRVPPYPGFYTDWLAILGLLMLFGYFVSGKETSIAIPVIAYVPLALALVIALQTAAGMILVNWDVLLPVAYLLLAAVATIAGASLAAREGGSEKLCLSLASLYLVTGLMSAVIASLQLAGADVLFAPYIATVPRGDTQVRPFANLGQPNQLALLFCLAAASVWWMFQVRRIRPGAAVAAMMVLVWGMAITQSRIVWMIIPLFALVSWNWNRKREFRNVSGKLVAVFIAAYLVFAQIFLPLLSSLYGAYTQSATERVASGGAGRMGLFSQAWQISMNHPWFGAGWFQFGPEQLSMASASDSPFSAYSHHAHNIILNFAAELGWPLTVLLFASAAYWFHRCCLAPKISKEAGFATLFFVAVMAHSQVEFPLWYAYILMPFALLAGSVHQERFGGKEIEVTCRQLAVPLVLMFAGLFAISMDYRRVVTGFWDMEIKSMGLVISGTTSSEPTFTALPQFYDYIRFMDIKVRKDMPDEEIAFMERTARRFAGAALLMRMSQAYALNGREDDAVRAMTAMYHLHRRVHYKMFYEQWRHAPAEYQAVFRRLPIPLDPI